MRIVFADTFYWVAVTNVQDSSHARAKEVAGTLGDATIVTTEDVLVEYLNYFANWTPYMRQKALSNVDEILGSTSVRVLEHRADTFSIGLDLYRARPDKGYSLTDCISMSAMRREGIQDVLTNDVHFVQEGFRVLFQN